MGGTDIVKSKAASKSEIWYFGMATVVICCLERFGDVWRAP